MPSRLLALMCVLAAASGCGKSENEKRLDRLRDLCLGFPAAGTTIRGATQAFSEPPVGQSVCLPGEDSGADGERWRRIVGDVCDHTGVVCQVGWCAFPENDPSLCGPTGCFYGCGVRVVPHDDGSGNLEITDDSVICASQWKSENPVCPF